MYEQKRYDAQLMRQMTKERETARLEEKEAHDEAAVAAASAAVGTPAQASAAAADASARSAAVGASQTKKRCEEEVRAAERACAQCGARA